MKFVNEKSKKKVLSEKTIKKIFFQNKISLFMELNDNETNLNNNKHNFNKR